jgi:hypothetical protein
MIIHAIAGKAKSACSKMLLQQLMSYNAYFCAGRGKENYTLMTENL